MIKINIFKLQEIILYYFYILILYNYYSIASTPPPPIKYNLQFSILNRLLIKCTLCILNLDQYSIL